jgi:hypothetical protein
MAGHRAHAGAVCALASILGVAACASDNIAPDAAPEPGPALLLAERVFTPQGSRFYYVSVLPDVPTAAVDRSKALELTSADIELYGDAIYIRDRDANTIARYRVAADLALVKDGEVSFAGVGLGTGRYSNAYLSPERAYVLDSGGWRLIGWNPTAMTLTGEIISIDNMAKHALPSGQISPAVQVGSRLVAAISWADFGNLVTYPGSGVIVLDPASPAAPAFIEDARVGGAFRVTADASGDAYVTGVVGGDVHMFGTVLGGAPSPTSGVLRLPAGQSAFDPSYLVDVEAITGSKGVWAIHRIDATTLLAQILDPDVASLATVVDYNASKDFEYALINTAAGTWTKLASPPKGGRGNAGNHVVDGVLYIQISDTTGSTAYAVSPTGITAAFTVPSGDVWHLQRVR